MDSMLSQGQDTKPAQPSVQNFIDGMDKILATDAEQIGALRLVVERLETIMVGPKPQPSTTEATRAPRIPCLQGVTQSACNNGSDRQALIMRLQRLLG